MDDWRLVANTNYQQSCYADSSLILIETAARFAALARGEDSLPETLPRRAAVSRNGVGRTVDIGATLDRWWQVRRQLLRPEACPPSPSELVQQLDNARNDLRAAVAVLRVERGTNVEGRVREVVTSSGSAPQFCLDILPQVAAALTEYLQLRSYSVCTSCNRRWHGQVRSAPDYSSAPTLPLNEAVLRDAHWVLSDAVSSKLGKRHERPVAECPHCSEVGKAQ